MHPILMNPVFWVITAWLVLGLGVVIYTIIALSCSIAKKEEGHNWDPDFFH